jgi:DNA replication protein DnaC
VPSLLLQLKDFNNPLSDEYKNDILNCDLIILDDIASTGISQYDLTQLMLYIEHRILYEKSIIFTGNIAPEELQSVLGERLASRIRAKNTVKIELKGADKR